MWCIGDLEALCHGVCELQEIRRRYGVYGAEALEGVLMFVDKNKEKADQCKMMLEELRSSDTW